MSIVNVAVPYALFPWPRCSLSLVICANIHARLELGSKDGPLLR
jgi:hypothetical protein